MALFSEARFQLQSTVDKHLFGNKGLALLEYPWPNADAGELLARLEQDVTTAGNSYMRKATPADGADDLLVQMRPDCVVIVSEEKRDSLGRIYKQPVGYLEDLKPLGITDREPQFYSTDEVCHYSPVPDPAALFRGMSWLSPVLREIGADAALTQYKTVHVQSGATPGLVIKYAQKLQRASIDAVREQTDAKYGGPGNAGRTLVLDQGADVTVAGSTMEQLQYTAVQQAGVERICAAAQVPLEVLGLGGGRAGLGNYQSAVRRFADLWARPHWRMACAALQHLIVFVSPDGSSSPLRPPTRLWYDVADIAALREGELERSQATLVRAQAIGAFVTAGYTRESAVAAAESGDMSQLVPDPRATPPGVAGRETSTTTEALGPGVRRPQAGVPQDLPGVVAKNLPNAKPGAFAPMPGTERSERLAMALTHEKLGKPGGPGLWHDKNRQLPAYIQHIANDLIQQRGMPESEAIATAISLCKKWAAGGKDVKPDTRAKAAAAVAEWERLKASAHATRSAPMTDLMRIYPLEDIHILSRAEGDGTGRVVEAYATVFDTEAEIHDHQGHYAEVIDRTAFDQVLQHITRSPGGLAANVKVLYNHGKTIGGAEAPEFQLPLGKPLDVRPEARGLLTRTEYDVSDPFTERILNKIHAGTITAQSFVGGIMRSSPELRGPGDKYRGRNGVLTKVRRMALGLREYGPVLFPAYSGAEILGVRMSIPGSLAEDEPDTPADEEYVPDMEDGRHRRHPRRGDLAPGARTQPVRDADTRGWHRTR